MVAIIAILLTTLSFHQIIQEEDLSSYNGNEISIRGFLYAVGKDQWILAPEPNLRTCCVASKNKIVQQIVLNGEWEEETGIVEMRGIFRIDPKKNGRGELVQLYRLDYPHLIEGFNPVKGLLWVAFATVAAGLGTFLFFRSRFGTHFNRGD